MDAKQAMGYAFITWIVVIQQLQGIFNGPILSVVLVGLLTKRVPAFAAKAGLVFGVVAYLVCNFLLKVNMHFFHLVGLLFAANVVFMLVIGYLFPSNHDYQEVYTKQVNIEPWEYVKHVSLLIVAAAIGVYVFMAPNVSQTMMYAYYALLAFTLVYLLQGVLVNRVQQHGMSEA